MKLSPFDNLPPLTKEEAFLILETPLQDLKLSSDYYKAIYHLSRYPSFETEEVLIKFIKLLSSDISIKIAKRKAVEVLGKFGCERAIPLIASNLRSSDPFLVENSAWSLQELRCNNSHIHKEIGSLLNDKNQNRRALIQSLSKMNAISEVPIIRNLLEEPNIKPGIKGSSIAALYNLNNEKTLISKLADYLSLPNQNDRQCAVQDIIDSEAISLLPIVIKAPISPAFKFNAISSLYSNIDSKININHIFQLIETVIIDSPLNINLLNNYESDCSLDYLINLLMNPDFSKGYASLVQLIDRMPDDVINSLLVSWDKLTNDYGAIYFLTILLRLIKVEDPNAIIKVKKMLFKCLGSYWPQFMKFRPSAILCLSKIDPINCNNYISSWLNEKDTPSWTARYATLMILEKYNNHEQILFQNNIKSCNEDTNIFVRAKAKSLLNKSIV